MRLNVKQHVLDYEGQPLMANKTNPDGSVVLGEDNRPVQEPEILRNYLALALNNTAQDEREVFTPEQKTKIYALAIGRKHRALARRIKKREEDYLKFAHDPAIPFTNNPAEQEIRMTKIRQKVSGTMRPKRSRKLRGPSVLPTNHRETRHPSHHRSHPADQQKPLAPRLPLTSYDTVNR